MFHREFLITVTLKSAAWVALTPQDTTTKGSPGYLTRTQIVTTSPLPTLYPPRASNDGKHPKEDSLVIDALLPRVLAERWEGRLVTLGWDREAPG